LGERIMAIKRYDAELHESCDWADAEEHPEGELVYVDDIRERLVEIDALVDAGGWGEAFTQIEKLIEELK
jgi:hypothetical protein